MNEFQDPNFLPLCPADFLDHQPARFIHRRQAGLNVQGSERAHLVKFSSKRAPGNASQPDHLTLAAFATFFLTAFTLALALAFGPDAVLVFARVEAGRGADVLGASWAEPSGAVFS